MATYVFTIGGVTQSLRPGWSINETANGRNTFSGAIQSLDASYRPDVGEEVILTEDGTRIFGGNVDVPSETSFERGWTPSLRLLVPSISMSSPTGAM
jgi:hypothetical protein